VGSIQQLWCRALHSPGQSIVYSIPVDAFSTTHELNLNHSTEEWYTKEKSAADTRGYTRIKTNRGRIFLKAGYD
jgi:hypothetical protein